MVIQNIRDKLDGDELDLSMMSLKEVPLKDIATVPRATTIDLSSNLLKSLPPSFGAQLSHVVKLDLSANKLTALPKTFHQLVNLKHLDLYNNQLTDLPVSLHHLSKLRFLDIKNNPLKPELQAIVGDCLTRKECETAAKKLVAHFTKEKQLAVEQEQMANKAREAREQQQREEAEAVRRINEKKAAKKERKNENKHMKQQQHQQQQHQQQQHAEGQQQRQTSSASSSTKASNGTAIKSQRRPTKGSRGGWCSCMGWLNMLLMACIATAAGWCLHLHVEGDYSQAGLQAAVPRLQKSFYKLQNVTVEALQPDNLRVTGQLAYKSVNASAYQAMQAAQNAAYATQAYLEVYTGDLTPYTSKVSQWSSVAYQFIKEQTCSAYHWLLAQDWQGMWTAVVNVLYAVWIKLQEFWSAALKIPIVAAVWDTVCHYASVALAWLQTCLVYLQVNGPVWLQLARDNTYNAIISLKESIQSLLK